MFVLSKWYLDAITDSGEFFTGHTGYFHWPPLYFGYATVMRGSPGRAPHVATSLRFHPEPVAAPDRILWHDSGLDVNGEWTPDSEPFAETIYASTQGVVDWGCVMPRALARIDNRDAGLGYIEHLKVTVVPWRLPIDKLRWGRFLTGALSVVWLDWTGAYHRKLVFRNGRREQVRHLDDHRIEFEDGAKLRLRTAQVLRSGPIGSTALRSIPGLQSCCPARLLAIDETKWLSQGTYESPDSSTQSGWAIHKRALWPL